MYCIIEDISMAITYRGMYSTVDSMAIICTGIASMATILRSCNLNDTRTYNGNTISIQVYLHM